MLSATCIFAVCALGGVSALSLRDDDICKETGRDSTWVCQPLKDCPSAQRTLDSGSRPVGCGFEGEDPFVCCPPSLRRPVRASSKSKEMCKKYAEYVFLEVTDPVDGAKVRLDSCHGIEPFITNGTEVFPREYPHMALIGYGEKSSIRWDCGGTLISDQFVLSAAHCSSSGSDVARWVKIGVYSLRPKKDVDGKPLPVDYEIIERIVHPEYKSPSVYNDIALFKLKSKLALTEDIRPACLQTQHGFHQTYAIATGWGRTEYGGKPTDFLQKVNVTILPKKQCDDAYKAAANSILDKGIIDDKMICAGDIENGKDTCTGDAGGPLQLRLKEPYCTYSVIGITSFGETCANKPTIYTRVSHYVPWIESIVWL